MSANPAEEKQDKELSQILGELRIALPGVQALFAFLLIVPFSDKFDEVSAVERAVFMVSVVCTALASMFYIAPSVYHRLNWRRPLGEKDEMLRIFNVLALTGGAFLACAIVSSLVFLTDVLFGPSGSIPMAMCSTIVCVSLWYVLPLLRGRRHRLSRRK